MNSSEARQIVQGGLDQKRAERKARIQEGQLEQYELDMIRRLNVHCRDKKEETAALELKKIRAAQRQEAQRKARELEEKGTMAVRKYVYACVGILLLVGFTNFPGWAAVALALGLAVFPAVYIYRLYVPLGVKA